MKKMLAAFVLMSSFCFSMTWEIEKNIKRASKLCFYAGPQKAIEFLTFLIDRDVTQDLDRVHYLYHRSLMNRCIGDDASYIADKERLEQLIESDESYAKEFFAYYDEK